RDFHVTGVQTCALPILEELRILTPNFPSSGPRLRISCYGGQAAYSRTEDRTPRTAHPRTTDRGPRTTDRAPRSQSCAISRCFTRTLTPCIPESPFFSASAMATERW